LARFMPIIRQGHLPPSAAVTVGEGHSGTGLKADGPRYLRRFSTERTISTGTTAAGGNATLLSLQMKLKALPPRLNNPLLRVLRYLTSARRGLGRNSELTDWRGGTGAFVLIPTRDGGHFLEGAAPCQNSRCESRHPWSERHRHV
jgi:hypothetical protein